MASALPRATPTAAADLAPAHRAPALWLLSVVVLLLALVALPPLANQWADTIRAQVNQAQAFSDALGGLESDLQLMQAAARGYLVAQNPAFLAQYRALQDGLPLRLQDLSRLAPAVSPDLAAQLDDLAAIVERWQREGSGRQLELAAQGRPDDAAAELATGSSQASFDAIRARIGEIRQRTLTARSELSAGLARARAAQLALTVGLGMAGLVAAGFVVVGFQRLGRLTRENDRLFAAAQTERQRLQAIFDHSPAAILVVEAPDGRAAMVNPAAQALLGELSEPQARRRPLAGRIFLPGGRPCPPDDLPLARTLDEGSSQRNREYVLERPGGERVPVLITSVPLHDPGGDLAGAVAVIQDLRHLREVERMKSDFVALVSHELRTPLAAIKGAAESLLRPGLTFDQRRWREYVELIDGQSDRLHELIDNLLSLSQVEAGALRLRRDLVAMAPLVQGVLRQHGDRLSAAQIRVEVPGDLPLLSADPRRIEQVLLNLLENAQKFSPPGRPITLSATRQGRELVVAVSDEGPGIPPAERERVFERFYQIARPHTRNVRGTGLGLAICKALVEAHGGRIWVEEAPGGGASVQFALPALSSEEDEDEDEAPVALARPGPGAKRVLVVDDDPALRRILERGLADAGYHVQSVMEPEAALAAITRQPPDLVLLDVMLPGTDGFTFCSQLREWTSVPIIMLTARGAELDLVRGLQLGADDYVTKPFRIGELLARMQAVLRRAEPTQPGEPALVRTGRLRINLAAREVRAGDRAATLTPTEYGILAFLARHLGQVMTHEQILRAVWGDSYGGESQYLWVHMAHLRQKLEQDPRRPRHLLTERSVGYRLAKLEPEG
ncbi:MAG TPA: response regulator [Chloroflexaceae bacterium]|nr:response regulator [Chloroflexaceae bacterium]